MPIQIERILFPTDFSSGAEQALAVTVRLARELEAELHVLRVAAFRTAEHHDPLAHLPDPDSVRIQLEAEALNAIERSLKAQNAADLDIRPVFRSGISPGPTIVDYTNEQLIDLVIMGTNGRRGLDRMMLGSTAEEVIRRAPCPVLTVRAGDAPVATAWKRILVPVDFSEHSEVALRTAFELAQILGTDLVLLHVVEPLKTMGISNYGHEISRNWESEQQKAADQLMREICAKLPEPCAPHQFKIVCGRPPVSITTVAEDSNVDLIVIATHGRTGLKRFLLGSVAEKVVRHSRCPVLTLKAFGRQLLEDPG